jgi:hypothetical protein
MVYSGSDALVPSHYRFVSPWSQIQRASLLMTLTSYCLTDQTRLEVGSGTFILQLEVLVLDALSSCPNSGKSKRDF